MSTPWNHLCWKDENIQWNITELLEIYNNVFSKYDRHYQDPTYRGIAFQGKESNDHISAIINGNIMVDPVSGIKCTVNKENLGKHLERQVKCNVRHTDLCVGEFGKILDYLENLGYLTHRARVMELGPGNHENWHFDSYEGCWGNNKRYHIPLITNDKAYLMWRDKGAHYFFNPKADGSAVWANTDVLHQYLNKGDTWRAHIVIDLIKK
jgi:hypothetical protein